MRILVVEDEKDLNRLITKKLKCAEYFVDSCFDGEEALNYIEITEYDGVVMDIMMPRLNGLQVLYKMRIQHNDTPVLLLTAKDRIEDRVEGLDQGADDYLVKPFAFDELMARIRAMTRKKTGNKTNSYQIADLVLETEKRRVTRAGKEIILSAKEFSLLEYMIVNKEIVLSREKLENHISSYDYDGSSNLVDVYIRYLRKKIDDEFENKLIHTIRGIGYVLKEK